MKFTKTDDFCLFICLKNSKDRLAEWIWYGSELFSLKVIILDLSGVKSKERLKLGLLSIVAKFKLFLSPLFCKDLRNEIFSLEIVRSSLDLNALELIDRSIYLEDAL